MVKMRDISLYIKELVIEKECVIVPGLGGFIARDRSSVIENNGTKILPPGKVVSFNSVIKDNDGLLASYISKVEGISYKEAMSYIDMIVLDWREQLSRGEVVRLEMIGELHNGREGCIEFFPYNELNSIESYGLMPVYVSPLRRRNQFLFYGERDVNVNVKLVMRYAASVILFALVLFMFLTNEGISKYSAYSWLMNIRGWYNNSGKEGNVVYKERVNDIYMDSSVVVEEADIDEEFLLHSGMDDINSRGKLIGGHNENVVLSRNDNGEKMLGVRSNSVGVEEKKSEYHLISGVFSDINNANNYIMELRDKGFTGYIIDTTDTKMYRVSIGSFEYSSDAISFMNSVKGKLGGVWILKK